MQLTHLSLILVRSHALLRRHHLDLAAQHNALCECLLQGGILPADKSDRQAPSDVNSVTVLDLLSTADVPSTIVQSAGSAAACCWLCASLACRQCLTCTLLLTQGKDVGLCLGRVHMRDSPPCGRTLLSVNAIEPAGRSEEGAEIHSGIWADFGLLKVLTSAMCTPSLNQFRLTGRACMLADAMRLQTESAPAPKFSPTPAGEISIRPDADGRRPGSGCVRLRGLRKRSDLNGKVGLMLADASEADRVKVHLCDGRSVRVQRGNVEPLPTHDRLHVLAAPLALHGAVAKAPHFLSALAASSGLPAASQLAAASRPFFLGLGGGAWLYVSGGRDGKRTLGTGECLNLATCRWRPMPLAMRARALAASALCGGIFYVCGGVDGSQVLNSVERFDPCTRAWKVMPPMSTARMQAFLGVIGGFLHVCGGRLDQIACASVERFDTGRRRWQTLAPMTEERAEPMGAAVAGTLLVCGGTREGVSLGSSERFDPSTGLWERLPPMSDLRARAAVLQVRDALYAFGGRGFEECLASAERFSLTSGDWERLPPMHQGRSGGTAALGQPSRIFVCSGFSGGGTWTEAFDLSSGAWELLQPPVPDLTYSFSTVAAGFLYICGGCGSKREARNKVVRLHLASGAWEELPPMAQKRAFASGFVCEA